MSFEVTEHSYFKKQGKSLSEANLWQFTQRAQHRYQHPPESRLWPYQPNAPTQLKIQHTLPAASYQHMAQTDKIYIWVQFEIGGFRKKLPSSQQVTGEREEGMGEEGGRQKHLSAPYLLLHSQWSLLMSPGRRSRSRASPLPCWKLE